MRKKFLSIVPLIFIMMQSIAAVLDNNDLFKDKKILVIGGSGYLGQAIITEVLKYNPNEIVVFSRDEVKHFNLTKIFGNNPKIHSVIGDIRDYNSVLKVTKTIDIVFHVAALKRIDLLEYNVEESIRTNILGTMNVFDACIANNVDSVLFISTDKACSPINAYGASKFLGEKVFSNYDRSKVNTKFITARFGNILASTGSIIPVFSEKIKNNQDLPLTDPQMSRFILSKEEAVDLMFDALHYGIGGEIFVKKIPALKVVDLIEILKTKFQSNNKVYISGLRPGEKLHEVLINEAEILRTYEFNDSYVIVPESLYANSSELPQYIVQGKKIKDKTIEKYSSDQAIISKELLTKLFEQLGLL